MFETLLRFERFSQVIKKPSLDELDRILLKTKLPKKQNFLVQYYKSVLTACNMLKTLISKEVGV